MGSVSGGIILWNVTARSSSCICVSVPTVGSMLSSCLVSSAGVKYFTATMMILSRVAAGILYLRGNHLIMLFILVDDVAGL